MKIKNWEKFQHFKNRRPPWIKLHREILDQLDINLISDCAFRVLVCMWLIASEDKDMEGNLPSPEEISFKIRIPIEKVNQSLQELIPFLEDHDIKAISKRYQSDPPEESREETETEVEDSIVEIDPNILTAMNKAKLFENLWKLYPSRQGKKDAIRHFNASVKTIEDDQKITRALGNYLTHLDINTWKRAMNGSTWFNNWQDWVDWIEPEAPTEQVVQKKSEAMKKLEAISGGRHVDQPCNSNQPYETITPTQVRPKQRRIAHDDGVMD